MLQLSIRGKQFMNIKRYNKITSTFTISFFLSKSQKRAPFNLSTAIFACSSDSSITKAVPQDFLQRLSRGKLILRGEMLMSQKSCWRCPSLDSSANPETLTPTFKAPGPESSCGSSGLEGWPFLKSTFWTKGIKLRFCKILGCFCK